MARKLTVAEIMLYNRIQQNIDKKELDSKFAWKHPLGVGVKRAKAIYYVSAVWSFLVYILNELIFFMMYGVDPTLVGQRARFFTYNRWLVHIMFVLAIGSFFFMITKKTKVACWCQVVVGGLNVIQIIQVFNGAYNGSNQNLLGIFYCVNLLPFLMAAFILLIGFAYHRRIKLAAEKEIQLLYKKYKDEDSLMNAREWESVLLKHEEALQK